MMLAIKGIYNGEIIKPLEPIEDKRHYLVAITFIEPIQEKNVSSKLKILKAEEMDGIKEIVSLGGDALEDTEKYYE